MVGRDLSRLVVGPVNIWACRASITVPGPADLPFRSGEASYQPLQASALSSEDSLLGRVCITNSSAVWRALGRALLCGTTAAF